MEDKLKIKLDDFTHWTLAAFEHCANHRYSDALTNMRKCGEAACKLIVYLKYNESVAGQKIGQKSFKELIELLISENLVPRKAVNLLEVFQIYGNLATHDNRIVASHAFYGIAALKLFTEWIFTEHLRILVPSKLKKFILPATENEKQLSDAEKKELVHLKKENELLKKEIHLHFEKLQHKEKESTEYKEQANQSKLEIGKFKTQVERLLTEKKKSESEKEISAVPEIAQNVKPKPYSKRILTASLIFLAISGITFGSYYFLEKDKNLPEKTEMPTAAKESMFTILILPFSIMQDNPNLNLKLEELIRRQALEKFKMKNRPVNILYLPRETQPAQSQQEAHDAAKLKNAQLVIYGDIYEQTVTDSIQAILKYLFINPDNPVEIKGSSEAGNKSFAKLTDSAAVILQKQIECVMEMSYAYSIYFKGQYSQALALANEIVPASDEMQLNSYELKTSCYYALNDYHRAKKQIENMILHDTTSAYAHHYMAKTLVQLGQYDSALYFYHKAILFDTTGEINYLINCADLLCSSYFKQFEMAKKIVQRALSRDSANARAWYYLAETELLLKNFPAAKQHFLKSLAIDSNFDAKINFAAMLAFKLKDPMSALPYFLSALQQDSTNSTVHYLLGDLYGMDAMRNPTLTEYHYKKSKEYAPKESSGTYLGMCIAAIDNNRINEAKNYALKAYLLDSARAIVCAYLGAIYYGLNQYDSAYYFLSKAHSIDPFDETANFHLGKIYLSENNIQYRNFKKAIEHIEKALQTDPDRLASLQYLGVAYFYSEEYEKAKKALLRLYALQPNNFDALRLLGSIYEQSGDYKQAKTFFENAISIFPGDDDVHSRLCVTLCRLGQYQLGLVHAQKAVEINPQRGDNHYRLSEIYVTLNNLHKAQESYQSAIDIDPKLKNADMEKNFR